MGTKKNFLDANGNIIEDQLCVEDDSHGLMCPEDRIKLDGIAENANNYTHPSYTARSAGLYKVTVDGTGHVSAVTAVAKADITGLGIPGSDTNTHYTTKIYAGVSGTASNSTATSPYVKVADDSTYRNQIRLIGAGATTVTSDASGNITITSTDTDTNTDTKVTSVENHYTPAADSSAALSVDASSSTAATWGTTNLVTGVNLQRDAKGHVTGVTVDSIKMPANPNSDTNTAHSHSAGVGLVGSGNAGISGTYTYKAKLRSETALTVDSAAATTTSGRVYPVAVDKTGYLAVNVPWTDTNTDTDTKNTAGSTDSSSKLFLIGATSQAANPQTYSHDTAYVGTDGCLYSGGSKVAIDSAKLDKLTYEWNKQYNAGGTAGYLLIGSFPMYDSNLTIDIDSTTTTTYHGTVIIATQNVSETSIGSAHTITVYGDPTGAISSAIRVVWNSGSRNYNVYFVPSTWSKNLIHIRAIGNYLENTDTSKICTQFTTGTAPATTSGLTVTNALTSNFNKYTHPTTSGNKHIPSGGSSGQILRWSADGTAAWGADNNTTYGVVSTTADGLAPKRDGSTTKFLRADGTWAVPPDTNTVYTHPSHTAVTGVPTANATPGFGGTFSVNQITNNNLGHVTGNTSRTITIPSTLSNGTGTAGLIKTTSTVTSNSGYTACPVISGVPYYKDTNTVYTHPSYTARTGVPTANATLSHGGTFTVTQPVCDATGHITAMNTRTYTLPADNNTDTKVTNTLATTTKAYVTGTSTASTNTGTQIFDTGVYLDTTAGRLTATSYKVGNAVLSYDSTNTALVISFV